MKKLFVVAVLLLSIPLTTLGCQDTKAASETNSPSTNSSESKTTDSKKTENTDTEVKTTSVEERNVRLFYYDAVADKSFYVDDTIEVKDKALVTAIVSALQEPKEANISPNISKEISVKSANLNSTNDVLTVDFSGNFVTAQNLGSGPEVSTLQAIVNTLGYNYNVSDVIITLDGKPYSSGHVAKEAGESFKVNYTNFTKY